MSEKRPANPRLAGEPSPYLQSAVHQPVAWYPWGPEAFKAAESQDKPVLLDIGAVWCHWCHVMDGESYEDPELARVINDRFIPIKVDRDERPDVDARYQRMVSVLTHQGGWPLTAFLTPKGQVFYGGTYFPPKEAHGRPSFRAVLEAVATAYDRQRDQVAQQAAGIEQALAEVVKSAPTEAGLGPQDHRQLLDALQGDHDPVHGGWGNAPKFPHPSALELLLLEAADGSPEFVMAQTTLVAMARGGIRDHVGGGFHRYSTDREWIVPHFEKMLYDNAELLRVYVHAYQDRVTPSAAEVAHETARFLTETLGDQRGGFRGSQDADVVFGDDGDFFTWTRAEVDAAVAEPELGRLLAERYGVKDRGPMHHNATKNVLHIAADIDDLAAVTKAHPQATRRRLDEGLGRLRAARARRKAPFVDPVLYTNWNAMAVRAFLEYSAVLDRPEAERFALKTLDRFLDEAYRPERGFVHTLGGKGIGGLLDDQAQMLCALVRAFSHTQSLRHLEAARSVARLLESEFWEDAEGAFADTARSFHDAEGVSVMARRQFPLQDAPSPSPNARAAEGLMMLGDVTGDASFHRRVDALLARSAAHARRYGLFATHLFLVARRRVEPAPKIVVAGPKDHPDLRDLRAAALAGCGPQGTVVVFSEGTARMGLPAEAEAFANGPARSRPGALVCFGNRCLAPVHEAARLRELLAAPAEPLVRPGAPR